MLDALRPRHRSRASRRSGRLRVPPRHGALSARFPHLAVAGAGIGGLAAALALARAGCTVSVFERSPVLAEAGAGVQLSPNACAVLARLGCLGELLPAAVEPAEVLIRRGRDGTPLARVPLGPAARQRYGHPSLVVLRADLQRALLAAAARTPDIALVLGRGVTGFTPDGQAVSVHLEGLSRGAWVLPRTSASPSRRDKQGGVGEPTPPCLGQAPARFDGLVAADGIRSVLRGTIAGAGTDALRPARRTAWRSLVPCEAAESDARVARSNLWLGPAAHLVHYPVDGGRRINVVAIIDHDPRTSAADRWSEPGDPAVLQRRLADWALPARRLVAAAPSWRCWALHDCVPLAGWTLGAVTLLGDAAHAMLPFLAQGAAQTLEDAAVLGEAVAASRDDLPSAFLRYDAKRRPRTARVQAASARQARIYHLGPPLSLARDLALRSLGPERLAARYDWLYGGG